MPMTQTSIPHAFAAATTVTGQQWDDNFNALAATMNSPMQPANYLVDTGVANAYVVAFGAGIVPTYTAGLMIQMLVLHSNTGASTVNVNALGAKNILLGGSALANGAMTAGTIVALQYDGTQFQLASSYQATTAVTAANATNVNGYTASIASATTPDIWTGTGNIVQYTGTATATGFAAAPSVGSQRKLICTGACLFTSSANLIIEGMASGTTITLAANSVVNVLAITTTQFLIGSGYVNVTAIPSISDFAHYFQSADIPVVFNTQPAAAHGLGGKPLLLTMVLKNATAELGYSIGDEITITSYDASTMSNTVVADATNITISIGSGITINNKNSNTRSAITAANWAFVVRAWK